MPARGYEFSFRVEHEKIKFVSTSGHVILFCLSYKHTNDDVFDDFPKISDHFPKISEEFSKLFRRPDERFRTFSEHFPKNCGRFSKITEDFRGRTNDISIIQEQILVLSKRLCSLSNGDHVIFMSEITCFIIWLPL